MKYSSTDYEQFTRTLHKQVIEQEGFEGVEVLHNVYFVGRSGAKHQIDVCWKMKVANVEQLFCVECKLFKSKVKKSDVAAFIAKIEDIGSARGLFVTTVGYQLGALRLAKHKDVVLMSATYELEHRPATLEVYFPRFHDVTTTFGVMSDEVAVELGKMSQDVVSANETEIYDSKGNNTGNLSDLTEYVEHHQDGHNVIDVQDTYIKVLGVLVQVTSLSYFYEREYVGWPLSGASSGWP